MDPGGTERLEQVRLRAALIVVLGVVVAALAGCGSSSSPAASVTPTQPGTSAVPSPASGSSAPATQTSSAPTDDCGGAVGRVTSAVSRFPQVTKVQTIAACHEVDIDTNLPSGVLGSPSATKGTAICNAAAKVAYQGAVSSITVTDSDGHELAAGLKSSGCIPG